MKRYIPNYAKLIASLILFALVQSSCKQKPAFNDLREIQYSTEIAPIISANCTFSGCHGDSTFQKFKLINYDDVINAGVKSGSPETSKFYNCLKSLNNEEIMPKRPYNELSTKQIQLIYVWIGQGAKNN